MGEAANKHVAAAEKLKVFFRTAYKAFCSGILPLVRICL
jgi:hypothetical protein